MGITAVQRRSHARREKLFNLFSRNLGFVKESPMVKMEPAFDEGYLCPICFQLFTRESLSTSYADHLTLEDVPPRALGGKPITLTCKPCNNRAGTDLDSHLVEMLKSELFFSGQSDVKRRATVKMEPAVAVNVDVRFIGGKTLDFKYDSNHANPTHIQRIHEYANAGMMPTIKVQIREGYRQNRPDIALLRIGYLTAFSQLGYGFLMNPNLAAIRRQILLPNETVLPDFGVLKGEFPDEIKNKVCIIRSPSEMRSFLVVIPISFLKKTTTYGVILPGPDSDGLSVYSRVAALRKSGSRLEVNHSVMMLPTDDYLTSKSLTFESFRYWARVMN